MVCDTPSQVLRPNYRPWLGARRPFCDWSFRVKAGRNFVIFVANVRRSQAYLLLVLPFGAHNLGVWHPFMNTMSLAAKRLTVSSAHSMAIADCVQLHCGAPKNWPLRLLAENFWQQATGSHKGHFWNRPLSLLATPAEPRWLRLPLDSHLL